MEVSLKEGTEEKVQKTALHTFKAGSQLDEDGVICRAWAA